MDTSNFKPFDWEKAVAGEPVVDRAGRPVTQITRFNGVKGGRCVAGVNGDGNLSIYHHDDGRFLGDKEDCVLDLFMAPTEKTVWVNHYRELLRPSKFVSLTYTSEQDAADATSVRHHFIGRSTFTFTE